MDVSWSRLSNTGIPLALPLMSLLASVSRIQTRMQRRRVNQAPKTSMLRNTNFQSTNRILPYTLDILPCCYNRWEEWDKTPLYYLQSKHKTKSSSIDTWTNKMADAADQDRSTVLAPCILSARVHECPSHCQIQSYNPLNDVMITKESKAIVYKDRSNDKEKCYFYYDFLMVCSCYWMRYWSLHPLHDRKTMLCECNRPTIHFPPR